MSQIILTGTITDIFPAELRGNFEKRRFWVKESPADRPQHWEIEVHQGMCNTLDSYRPGDAVKCTCYLQGRQWSRDGKTSVFNSVKCTGIERHGALPKPPASERQQTGGIPPQQPAKQASDPFPKS